MKARATKKHLRGSPRKMRLVIDLIRGKNVAEAEAILRFSPKRAAAEAAKVLMSAYTNLEYKDQQAQTNDEDYEPVTIDRSSVVISEAFVNQGRVMKRIQPAPMGRAYRVRKRSNHLTIVVSVDN